MSGKIIKTLVKKEMLDVLRDKKTVLMMLVVPIILYPLIFVGVMQIMAMISSGMEEQTYRIAIRSETGEALLEQRLKEAGEERETPVELAEASLIENYEAALNEEEIDVYVVEQKQDGKVSYTLYYLSSVTNSAYALDVVEDMLEEYKEDIRVQKIEAAGLDADEILEPVVYEEADIASTEQSLGSIMGMILPFMLIVSLLMGTMYPAIDTTAGERERGTLETILTLPVTNRQLIISKFLTVAAIGLVSAALNIVSMSGIAFYMYQVMDLTLEEGVSVAWGSFIPVLLVTILAILAFSLFISAVTMCVTAFAKSYKEANNYITPLLLVFMLTGYIAFIPNVELTRTMAMVPVANISLLLKNLMAFKYDYAIITIVILSNVAYAVLAILFLSRIYDSESILFGEGKGGMQLLEKRSNMKKGGVPDVSDAWFMIALTIVMMLYLGSMLQLRFGIGGVFGTQMILLLMPLLFVWYTKRDVKRTYCFYKAKPAAYLGAFLMIPGITVIVMVLSVFLMKLFPGSAGAVTDAFGEILSGNVWIQIAVISITPAICEEMLFRGFLFSAMRNRYRAVTAILIVAALFGVYHMSLVKFFTTGLLGFVFCYIVYLTGSIFPAMLMHCVNNLIAVLLSYAPVSERVSRVLPILYEEEFAVSDVLLLTGFGILLTVLGFSIIRKWGTERISRGHVG